MCPYLRRQLHRLTSNRWRWLRKTWSLSQTVPVFVAWNDGLLLEWKGVVCTVDLRSCQGVAVSLYGLAHRTDHYISFNIQANAITQDQVMTVHRKQQ